MFSKEDKLKQLRIYSETHRLLLNNGIYIDKELDKLLKKLSVNLYKQSLNIRNQHSINTKLSEKTFKILWKIIEKTEHKLTVYEFNHWNNDISFIYKGSIIKITV